MSFPFEVSFDELQSDLDAYVDAVFGCLDSEFLVMPKGEGFVEFPVFESGYEALKRGTEDDGTARDKVTRVQHLGSLSREGRPADQPRFEVVACIAGRGFGEPRQDMKKLLIATRGKVFTLQNMHQLVEHSRLAEFRSR